MIICLLPSAFSYINLKSRGPKQSATDVPYNQHGTWIQLACKLSSQGYSCGLLGKQAACFAKIDRKGMIKMSGFNHMFNLLFISATMTGSYYDKNLKMFMTHSGSQEPYRWSVLDQSDQSFVLCFSLLHLTTTTFNAQSMIYRRVCYTFILRLDCYKCISVFQWNQ